MGEDRWVLDDDLNVIEPLLTPPKGMEGWSLVTITDTETDVIATFTCRISGKLSDLGNPCRIYWPQLTMTYTPLMDQPAPLVVKLAHKAIRVGSPDVRRYKATIIQDNQKAYIDSCRLEARNTHDTQTGHPAVFTAKHVYLTMDGEPLWIPIGVKP
jgi:hypothetical protein